MTSLLSGLMKISGKLPLVSTADTVLPSATAKRGRFGRGCSGMSDAGSGGVGGGREQEKTGAGPAGARERARNFTRISETNFSGALRSRQAGVVNF